MLRLAWSVGHTRSQGKYPTALVCCRSEMANASRMRGVRLAQSIAVPDRLRIRLSQYRGLLERCHGAARQHTRRAAPTALPTGRVRPCTPIAHWSISAAWSEARRSLTATRLKGSPLPQGRSVFHRQVRLAEDTGEANGALSHTARFGMAHPDAVCKGYHDVVPKLARLPSGTTNRAVER